MKTSWGYNGMGNFKDYAISPSNYGFKSSFSDLLLLTVMIMINFIAILITTSHLILGDEIQNSGYHGVCNAQLSII